MCERLNNQMHPSGAAALAPLEGELLSAAKLRGLFVNRAQNPSGFAIAQPRQIVNQVQHFSRRLQQEFSNQDTF